MLRLTGDARLPVREYLLAECTEFFFCQLALGVVDTPRANHESKLTVPILRVVNSGQVAKVSQVFTSGFLSLVIRELANQAPIQWESGVVITISSAVTASWIFVL